MKPDETRVGVAATFNCRRMCGDKVISCEVEEEGDESGILRL